MTQSSMMADAAPRPRRFGLVQRLRWWTADYFYAAKRQLAIFAPPWPVGRTKPVPARWRQGSTDLPEIVLLPGVYEHWTFLRPLGDALARAGYRVSIVHGLGTNRRSISATAERLGRTLASRPAPESGRIIVAHSKGGLIGKHLLVASGAAAAAAAEAAAGGDPAKAAAEASAPAGGPALGLVGMVAIATPFGGSPLARMFVIPSIRAFLPDDQTIVSLGRERSVNGRIVSIFAPFDPHIPGGSALEGATNVEIPTFGHFHVLGSDKTHTAVITAVRMLTSD